MKFDLAFVFRREVKFVVVLHSFISAKVSFLNCVSTFMYSEYRLGKR
ncbi:unnamed protein product [Acanthoscelides obtectus]|uniref:Uncharacterized protein n=1 Tax=Acanthoscelides obtectus TaxID=200917 RepID=A0A9P0JTV8_ACAOB|nr:unnamed protein product [Acanthoscelides obtectus]CAK1679259.1 hypothetical protein AOBTE_LOCUS32191 [Acanthoscelides obtectus]